MENELQIIPLDDNRRYFYSEDFDECSSLGAAGYPVLSIDSTKSRAVFIIKREEGIEQAIRDYWSGALMVSAFRLASVRRDLKARLYRTKNERY